MVFKLNISQKGKAWKLELDSEILVGKKLNEKIPGKEISQDLDGYELEITGATDFAGFPHMKNFEGPERRKVLLTKGPGLHKRPKKEGKKKVSTPKGLRYRKSQRGNQISDKTIQINLKVEKEGSKKLAEIFPDQNKKEEAPATSTDNTQDTPKPTPAESTSTTEQVTDNKPTDSSSTPQDNKDKVEKEVEKEVAEEVKESIPESPETKTEEQKEEAAEKVAEEIVEESKEAIDESAGKS
tara:strand:+ start:2553 stop:3272 length:720 start_codon:yes stop_codon:yes gene_type:complete